MKPPCPGPLQVGPGLQQPPNHRRAVAARRPVQRREAPQRGLLDVRSSGHEAVQHLPASVVSPWDVKGKPWNTNQTWERLCFINTLKYKWKHPEDLNFKKE